MYRVVTNIVIQQIPSNEWPNRKTVLNFDFVTNFEFSNSWRDLTNKGKITIPKNLYYIDADGKKKPLTGGNVNIGGFTSNAPLILRGDKVAISAGYKYFTIEGKEVTRAASIAVGYVSKVGSKIPIEIDFEDNMWLLKLLPVATKSFTKNDTLEAILKFILTGTDFTVNALTQTTFGDFNIGNETAAQVLQRLQKTYGFEFYFKGNELRGGAKIYVESEAKDYPFEFQQNIIEDELEYSRKDDVTLSAIAHNTITEANGACKDGTPKTKHTRLEVLVTMVKNPALGAAQYIAKVKGKGETLPENTEGERRTLFFPGANSVAELAELAYSELKKYYYTGLKGNFTTFGMPKIEVGDNVTLSDKKLPERNGKYRVKSVDYSGGTTGLRQKVSLDFKISV